MAIYVFNATTGTLVSWCPNDTDPVASAEVLAAQGLTAATGLAPLDSTHQWSAAQQTVVTVPAPTPTLIAAYQFILLFTPAEHAAIVASTDAKVQQFLMAIQVAQTINLADAVVQGALAYLVSLNLLTQANATLILSAQPSQ